MHEPPRHKQEHSTLKGRNDKKGTRGKRNGMDITVFTLPGISMIQNPFPESDCKSFSKLWLSVSVHILQMHSLLSVKLHSFDSRNIHAPQMFMNV